jgi:nucleoside-diphosphate-sugar epimerase
MFAHLTNAELTEQLKGKDCLIVGGTEGIGLQLAKELNKHGAHVTVTSARKENAYYLPRGVEYIHANVSTMRGAQHLGTDLLQGRNFDTVVFAGGFVTRPLLFMWGETAEEDATSSFLSRFIILRELIHSNALKDRKRVYILGYPGDDQIMSNYEDMWFDWHEPKDIPWHLNTVHMNDAIIKEAARRYPDLRIYGVNPGFISPEGGSDVQWEGRHFISRIMERLLAFGMKTPHQYVSKTLIQIVATPELDDKAKSGAYINDKMEELPPKKWMAKLEHRQQVWDNSQRMVAKALG